MYVLAIQVNAFASGAYFHSGSRCIHIVFPTAVSLLLTHTDFSGMTAATLLGKPNKLQSHVSLGGCKLADFGLSQMKDTKHERIGISLIVA